MLRFVIMISLSLLLPVVTRADEREVPPFLNTDQLGKLLQEIGHEPTALTKEVFQITIEREGWKVHLLVSLSKEGERVWLESKFSPLADAERVPAVAWRRLLEMNDKIGPAHFAYDKADQRIHLLKAFDNSQVTAERLKKEIVAFDTTIRETHDVWRVAAFGPEREVLTVAPRLVDETTAALAGFQGKWHIVRIELRGKVVTETQLAESLPTLTFTDEAACLRSSADNERHVKVKLEPTSKRKQIDFVDEKGRIEKGIYECVGDRVTLCFAAPGAERPTQFVADEDNGTWMLVLRRKPLVTPSTP